MRKLIGLAAGVAMVFALALPVAATDKVTICHATSSAGNPFVAIKVSANSGYEPHLSDNPGNSPLAGHEQDFLLENTDLETCDQVADVATPLAPSVSDATCEAAGTLTLTAVDGITYSIEPAYTVGDSGDFTVTATADEGWTIEEGAQTVFEVSVPAALDCPAGCCGACSFRHWADVRGAGEPDHHRHTGRDLYRDAGLHGWRIRHVHDRRGG